MADEPSDLEGLLESYAEIEAKGESVIVARRQLVVLDAQRNKNREALRQLYTKSKHKTRPEKSWVALGKTFHKMNTQECIDMLELDQKAINKEINQLQDEVKKKVFELNKMEGKSTAKGFDLKSMKYEDLTNIVEQLN